MAGRTQVSWSIGLFFVLSPRTVLPAVDIKASTHCLDENRLGPRLQDILVNHAKSREVDLLITVEDREASGNTEVILRGITGDGDLVLDRHFTLSTSDCESSTDLLVTVSTRFVQELPLERWTLGRTPVPVRAALPRPPPKALSISVCGQLAAYLAFLPTGGSFGGTVITYIGNKTHALSIEASTLASYPRDLGQGQFYTVLLEGGAGWKYSPSPWLVRISVHAGALMAAGHGFKSNEATWVPWTELTAGFGRSFGPLAIAGNVAISPFRHTAATAGEEQSRDISNFRLGLAVEFPIWGEEFSMQDAASGD